MSGTPLVIYTFSAGRFGNQLLRFLHWAAWVRERDFRCSVLHLPFWPYAKLFSEWSVRPACVYPAGGNWVNPLARLVDRLPNANWKLQRIALRAARHLGPMGVDLLEKPDQGIVDLEDPAFVGRALAARYLVCAGWEYSCWFWLERHSAEVRRLFVPLPQYAEPAGAFIAGLRAQYDVLIGVFARRGDYRTFFDGRFYYSWSDYARWAREAVEHHAGQRVVILIASDDPIPIEAFNGLPEVLATGSVNRGGHWLESFLELAHCDIILGPPSTFVACAAFYGDKPWWPLRSQPELADRSSPRQAHLRRGTRLRDRVVGAVNGRCVMLPVIHVHLGPSMPRYYWDTVRQTRRFHSGPIFGVIPPEAMGAPELAELSVQGIANTRWDGASAVRRLRDVSWLNSLYGANGFWHYTLERLFVMAELMREEGLPRILHLENDVTIYFDPAKMAGTMERCFGEYCGVTPAGPGEGCTAAILYAGSRQALDAICAAILRLLPEGDRKLRSVLSSGMVNESILLGIIQRHEPDLVRSFPIAPTAPICPAIVPRLWPRPAAPLLRWLDRVAPRIATKLPPHGLSNCLDEFESLFDGASWGQYAGGTPHGHGPGVAFRHHWIGPDLLNGRFTLRWRTDDSGRRFPLVFDQSQGGREWKLNNLHIHCKRIQDFV